MAQKTNLVFLGCNYRNKKVKSHFDQLKAKWESAYPIHVVLIDKENGKGARDLWGEIKSAIMDSSLAVFDVSAFRPNVVLELGYALARKDVEDIVVSFDERAAKGKTPDWLLSDISHLNQIRYKELAALDKKLDENLEKVPAVKRWRALQKEADRQPQSAVKYHDVCSKILQTLSNKKSMTEHEVDEVGKGLAVRTDKVHRLLMGHKLAKRTPGRNPKWILVEE
jgi:hypothetical protein